MKERHIARIAGYSRDGKEAVNPALQEASSAFRADSRERAQEPLRAGLLDYVAVLLFAGGVLAIYLDMLAGGGLLFWGILIPVGLFLELAAISLRHRRRHNFYK
ncbi:MAG: hypothetical protein KGY55_03885 [Candidatus Thermoplasmatota archaeon]|nr:hypothetical protein [Candidatus Thermoplasmatota archaeon]